MIPLCLVTGFLGSGKTTLLHRIATGNRDGRLVFLVNDFAAVDVDGRLLEETGDPVVSVAGGSIFCTCLVTEFIDRLGAIAEGRDGLPEHPDGVVIEASGIADPRVIDAMLAETRLDRRYELKQIISVVDPGSVLKLLQTLPNIRNQIEAADLVVVNKLDVYPEERIQEVESTIRGINGQARLVRATQCDVELDLFTSRGTMAPDGEYAKCSDPNYARFTVPSGPGRLDVDRLAEQIRSRPEDLYRVKGFVYRGDECVYLDHSSSGLTLTSRFCPDPSPELVFIVPGLREAKIEEWLSGVI